MARGVFIGLDVGTKTIGVATSSGVMAIASPWFTLQREGVAQDVARLRTAISADKRNVVAVIVGLPLEMDEAERRICRLARQVGDAIAAASGWPVHYQDERWTTLEARRRLTERGVHPRDHKATIDAEAAAVILEDWLKSNR